MGHYDDLRDKDLDNKPYMGGVIQQLDAQNAKQKRLNEKDEMITKLKEEILQEDPYFYVSKSGRVEIKGLPNNSKIRLNGDAFILENGGLVFNGGAIIDFTETFK